MNLSLVSIAAGLGVCFSGYALAAMLFRSLIIQRERRRAERRAWRLERKRYEDVLAALRSAGDPIVRDKLHDLIARRQGEGPVLSDDAAAAEQSD